MRAFLRLILIKLKIFSTMIPMDLSRSQIFNHFSRFQKRHEVFLTTLLLNRVMIFKKFTPVAFQKQQE